jgi:polysaccharide export outer membrane protein
MKVLDAVLEAGGLNEFAKESEIKIVRKNKSDRTVEIKIRMGRILNGKDVAQNIQLNPGDYVVINEGIF